MSSKVDSRITRVRYVHPAPGAYTEGDADWLPTAIRMTEQNGSRVEVYLSDHEAWFTLVEGPRWRIETLRAVLAPLDLRGEEKRA